MGWPPPGGGSCDCSICPAGEARTGREPLYSALEPKGLSLNRPESALQPASPITITAIAITRGRDHNSPIPKDMAYSLLRNATNRRVNTWEVNKTLTYYLL